MSTKLYIDVIDGTTVLIQGKVDTLRPSGHPVTPSFTSLHLPENPNRRGVEGNIEWERERGRLSGEQKRGRERAEMKCRVEDGRIECNAEFHAVWELSFITSALEGAGPGGTQMQTKILIS